MSAILFGSIGTVADTSELQRRAFNEAFSKHGLDWVWQKDEYITLLEKSGGHQRIQDYAEIKGQSVNATAIHRDKSAIFQQTLEKEGIEPRAGVVEVVQQAKQSGMKLALVTTTSEENVSSMLKALENTLAADCFDLVLNRAHVKAGKPDEEAYLLAMKKLEQPPNSCVAIEDNLGGITSAKSAGLTCVAFPNSNTAHHDFSKADMQVSALEFEQLQTLIPNKRTHPTAAVRLH